MAQTSGSTSPNHIAVEVCSKLGHDIQSLEQTPVFDVNNRVHHQVRVILCVKCGMGLDKLQSWTRSRTRPRKNEKNKEGEGQNAS